MGARPLEAGYAAEFPRVLRRFALFAIAFSIVSITTGIFVNYSYGLTQLGPAAVWLWPVAAVGQLLVVLVLAELAGHMPLAGANYQWTARLVDTRFGYVVGSLGVLYGAVGLPGHRAGRARPADRHGARTGPRGRAPAAVHRRARAGRGLPGEHRAGAAGRRG